ncbi:MAG TPA: pentapeptide repeat-containing protein [Candidatus Acidoferrales bacterium]|nr:pentapeptide repeat-containing protein [Candidatus Acidoferrales bacterium]
MQLEQKPVPEPAPLDPWSGPVAPKIKPEPIKKTWRNDQDPNRRRATFGVPYPLWEIAIDKSEDLHTKLPARFEKTKRRSVQSVRFRLRVPNLIFSDADFHECKFHRPDDGGDSNISGSTFKNCKFERCILGGTSFRHVTFVGCTFFRSDFGASQFSECQFLDCKFTECTAENTSLLATEIDPTAFLSGMLPPVYNYVDPIPAGEATAAQIEEDWVEVRRKLAAQLLRSNTEIHNTGHADRGLFELKRAEVRARFEGLRTRPLKEGWARLPLRAAQVLVAWVVLHATKGGTSLSRLFLGGIIFVPVYALLLSTSHVKFMNQDCYLHFLEPSLVIQQLARATSLFLAIGYTAFSGGILATVLLTVGALLGLLWYALVAAVVIHRVYR